MVRLALMGCLVLYDVIAEQKRSVSVKTSDMFGLAGTDRLPNTLSGKMDPINAWCFLLID